MTIPVPPDLTTDAADAYRAGWAAALAAVRAAVDAAGAEPVRDPGSRQWMRWWGGGVVGRSVVHEQRGEVLPSSGATFRVTDYTPEQPGDREPTGLDPRGG